MNPELLKQALIAALLKKQGGTPNVPPPPQFDPSLQPSTEEQRMALRKALQK